MALLVNIFITKVTGSLDWNSHENQDLLSAAAFPKWLNSYVKYKRTEAATTQLEYHISRSCNRNAKRMITIFLTKRYLLVLSCDFCPYEACQWQAVANTKWQCPEKYQELQRPWLARQNSYRNGHQKSKTGQWARQRRFGPEEPWVKDKVSDTGIIIAAW